MKLFKKLLLLLTLGVCVFSMTACSSTNLSTNGYLWFKNTSAFARHGWTETSTYDVSFVHATPHNSTEVKVDGYSLEITEGKYITTLKTFRDNGNYYEYTTKLILKFKYIVPNPETEGVYETHEETVNTTTKFKENLTPVKSVKTYSSTFSNYHYEYEINYSGSTATANLTETDLEGNYPNKQNFTFKKYNKKAYIDNDILLLIPRLFNVDDNFSREFRTIDVLSNKNFDMQMYAYLNDGNVDVKNLENYVLNGVDLKTQSETVSCGHVQIVIDDVFSGNPIDCYYAQDRDTHRHRLVETYTRFGTLGYLKFHLAEVKIDDD